MGDNFAVPNIFCQLLGPVQRNSAIGTAMHHSRILPALNHDESNV